MTRPRIYFHPSLRAINTVTDPFCLTRILDSRTSTCESRSRERHLGDFDGIKHVFDKTQDSAKKKVKILVGDLFLLSAFHRLTCGFNHVANGQVKRLPSITVSSLKHFVLASSLCSNSLVRKTNFPLTLTSSFLFSTSSPLLRLALVISTAQSTQKSDKRDLLRSQIMKEKLVENARTTKAKQREREERFMAQCQCQACD